MARKILLADDSVTAQNMGRKILVDAGYDVLTVNNGSAALKRITETKPDLIILDVYMPGYSGLEVCQRLKDAPETAHIPVLLSVGKLEPFKPQEARRVKANAHIVKPFEASELLSAIARLEDGMVPQAHKPSFCSPLPNNEGFSDDGLPSWETKTDSVRKGRGSRKKEKEPEVQDAVANFRDFRKGKENTEEAEAAATEMPRDITTEELDALSAVAAKLDGSVAPVSGDPAQVDRTLEESAPVSSQSPPAHPRRRASDRAEDERAAAISIQAMEVAAAETTAPVELTVTAQDVAGLAAAQNETEIQQVESPKEVAATEERVEAAQSESPGVGSRTAESQKAEPPTETPAAFESPAAEIPANREVIAETVNTGLLEEEPAPIDQQDEPIFAVPIVQEKVEAPTVEAEQSTVHAEAEVRKEEAAEEKSEAVEIKSDEATTVEEAKVPVAASAETVEAEVAAPSDEELAEALRLLTPATAYAEATVLSGQTNGIGADAAAGAHWMAEVVALSPEEAAMSLEAEMFRTFATMPARENDSDPAAGKISATITEAVENRLAEVARQSESGSEVAPKAMAAAAAAEISAPPENPTPGSEEGAIASIVDKVLADLRPKIVEEIAKKLGQSH